MKWLLNHYRNFLELRPVETVTLTILSYFAFPAVILFLGSTFSDQETVIHRVGVFFWSCWFLYSFYYASKRIRNWFHPSATVHRAYLIYGDIIEKRPMVTLSVTLMSFYFLPVFVLKFARHLFPNEILAGHFMMFLVLLWCVYAMFFWVRYLAKMFFRTK